MTSEGWKPTLDFQNCLLKTGLSAVLSKVIKLALNLANFRMR
jgi:hypothetical protein